MSTSDTFSTLLSFYEKANLCLRIAIFIALTWPLSALVIAMFARPSLAQTLVPLVDMIPILAVFFIVLAVPFGLVLLLRDPIARKGFVYFSGFIGAELALGVYLSLIPVSSDTGLVPLLILSAMALVFLKIANIAQAVRVVLGLLLVGITIIFIVGGRTAMKAKLQSSPSFIPKPVAATNQAPPINPTPQPSPQTVPTTDDLPAPRQPKPFTPLWNHAQEGAVDSLVFSVPPCILRAALVHCFFRITNREEEMNLEINNRNRMNATRIIDNLGNEYLAVAVKLGASTDEIRASSDFPPDIPILGSATFENVAGTQIAMLEINVSRGMAGTLVIRIKDLDIIREAP